MNWLAQRAFETPGGQFAYLAPLYNQVKTAAWDALKAAIDSPGMTYNESELRVDCANGARIQLFGADNYQRLRGMHFDGIVLDEFASMHPNAWGEVLRPTLSIKQGFAIFIGTPLGPNHFLDKYEEARRDPEWFHALYRYQDCGVFDTKPGEIASARATMSPEQFAQEYECSFSAAVHGAYYARQLEQARAEGRIRSVPIEPALPVDTWWDIGIGDATAIIFTQSVGREVHVIDYLEARGQELAFYARELQRRAYLYREHVLPHDANARELGSGKSVADQFRALVSPHGQLPRVRVLPQGDLEPGIEQARRVFPRCWFDETRCALLLKALMQYRQDWTERGQTFKPTPRHDWTSHAADAFRYLAVGLRPAEFHERPLKPYHARTAFNPLTHGTARRPPLLRTTPFA